MKLSSKEKILLVLLGSILVSVSYYQLSYTKQIDKISILEEKRNNLQTRYEEVKEMLAKLEEKQEEIGFITSSINLKAKTFYPTLIQEKLILEIDTFLKESNLKGDIGFSEIAVSSVELLQRNKNQMGDTSFKDIVNEYNGTSAGNDQQNQEQVSQPSTEVKNSDATVEIMKVNINFKGKFDVIKSFISKIETSNREIVITDLTTSVGYGGELSGTMSLEFYAIPKITERDSEYLQWTLDGSYGKEVPFLIQNPQVTVQPPSSNSSNGSSDSDSNESGVTDTTQSNIDFAVQVRSITSDLPTVMIGKSNDNTKDTYISVVNNNVEEAQIELTKKNGKYYYKYNNTSKHYPSDYTGLGIEYLPKSDRIIIDISSEGRINVDDKSGLQLNVVNNTDKIVEVQIKGDDKTNPRVSITGDSSKVTVTKK